MSKEYHGKNVSFLKYLLSQKNCNVLPVKIVPGCTLEDVEGGDDVRPERGQEVSPVLLSCELTTDGVLCGSIGQPCPAWANQFPASSPGSHAASMARALRRSGGGAMEHKSILHMDLYMRCVMNTEECCTKQARPMLYLPTLVRLRDLPSSV